ncbi:hypothetical protein [Granulicella sibirica]|uniref:Uncharacterized protein n=1 Tax=Granulicella sibirica TaxID=2479048 RepID=A0A4Q0SZN1_9BACT|nr:hypothetical protein [Granulicella sibirica]RXH54979.1 hypothetical protein GRAN_4083 [Granulicella sibirica]
MTGAPPAEDAEHEAVRARMMKMLVAYGADGSYHVRMPAQSIQGKWDAESHTYSMKDGVPLHFERTPTGLTLALPPDGKESHLYLKDTMMEAAKP